MVVVTFSGVPMLGGIVIWGRTDWILLVTKTSLTREVIRLDFPVPSSPQTQMRTDKCYWAGTARQGWGGRERWDIPVAMLSQACKAARRNYCPPIAGRGKSTQGG